MTVVLRSSRRGAYLARCQSKVWLRGGKAAGSLLAYKASGHVKVVYEKKAAMRQVRVNAVIPDPATIVSGSIHDAPAEFFDDISEYLSESK